MKNTLGTSLTVTLFGESHGEAIGAVLDGVASGIDVDLDFIADMLTLRRPIGSISTPRREADNFKILSGVFEGKTTGTPICIVIENADTHSSDYGEMAYKARPSHADFAANVKYNGFQDYRGGGHFSGRITAALVAAAGIIMPALNKKGIYIGTHIKRLGGINDREFSNYQDDIKALSNLEFAVLDGAVKDSMTEKIKQVKSEGDSIGGVLETAVFGLPAGVGEPWFDTLEGTLSHALFSIPAVKGVEFGAGFSIADLKGSVANDAFSAQNGKVITLTNNSGGIQGGISNGMPIIFRTAIKPTPTISIEQHTVDMRDNTETVLAAKGRHDPCIVHRARIVADSVTALVLADMLALRFGTDWISK